METKRNEIGMIGLGVMGRNMLLNMADHGFSVAGYDKDPSKVEALQKESAGTKIQTAANMQDFIGLLRSPRAVMMLVPAGPPVDSVIGEVLPHLEKGDLIIDAGNSYFKDTDLRARNLAGKGIHFLGVGVSGGEEGARHGASIMPGGPKEAYQRVRLLLEAVAAKVGSEACVTYLGQGSAGHPALRKLLDIAPRLSGMKLHGRVHHGDIAEGEDVLRLQTEHRIDIGRPTPYAFDGHQLFPRQA